MTFQIYESTYDNGYKVGMAFEIKRLNKCNKVQHTKGSGKKSACALKNVEKLLNKANIHHALHMNKQENKNLNFRVSKFQDMKFKNHYINFDSKFSGKSLASLLFP